MRLIDRHFIFVSFLAGKMAERGGQRQEEEEEEEEKKRDRSH